MVHVIFSGHFQSGTGVYGSIQQWVNTPSLPICRRCRVCNNFYAQVLDYIDLPKIITFELRDKTTVLNTIVSVKQLSDADFDYRLAEIVYFGNTHFITHIIKQDGQIWFYDGITHLQSNL